MINKIKANGTNSFDELTFIKNLPNKVFTIYLQGATLRGPNITDHFMIKQGSRKSCLVLKEYFIVFQDIPMELIWLLNENSIVPFRACFLRLGIM